MTNTPKNIGPFGENECEDNFKCELYQFFSQPFNFFMLVVFIALIVGLTLTMRV